MMRSVPSRRGSHWWRRMMITLAGAVLLIAGVWWKLAPPVAWAGLLQEMPRFLRPGVALLFRQGAVPALRREDNGSRLFDTSRAAAFPTVMIIRPDSTAAAAKAQAFHDALTDANFFPEVDAVLLPTNDREADCDVTVTNALQRRGTRPAVVYTIGACATGAVSTVMQREAAMQGDRANASPRGDVRVVFSDVDEVTARCVTDMARETKAHYAIGGVIAGPSEAMQWQWARRYLPHQAPLRIGYWRGEPMTGIGVLQKRSLVGGSTSGQTTSALGMRADATEGIEVVMADGALDSAVAYWRAKGVRLLYVDGRTPETVTRAALAAGIGTFCAADALPREAMPGRCLLRVMPLPQAAAAMAARLALQMMREGQPSPSGVMPLHANARQAAWQALPQGPLQLDIAVARRLRQIPPLSLLDDVQIVDDGADGVDNAGLHGTTDH
ncbi:hypothetical protein [Robbsia andropogonis]|uniref:hypothetical protein n=1 Tax=Robbsia andropogonis TaxID=28092 RepID=UPI0004B25D77|nr:hypothetical protein [Robbsia andropogonis]MCP1117095.1 hypothetical protein [Robbsia andropogonis]MCP1128441.1 hypothetical protein [Robbsia andropogonis]